MTYGENPGLSEDQKQLIRQALSQQWRDVHQWKHFESDQATRDRLTERLRLIEDTVADIEGL